MTKTADTETEPSIVAVGDILYSSWGYDQTNIDFYIVRRVTKASAWIEAIGSKEVGAESFMSGRVVANPDAPSGKVSMHRIRTGYRGTVALRLTSYSSAYPWDGNPKHYSRDA